MKKGDPPYDGIHSFSAVFPSIFFIFISFFFDDHMCPTIFLPASLERIDCWMLLFKYLFEPPRLWDDFQIIPEDLVSTHCLYCRAAGFCHLKNRSGLLQLRSYFFKILHFHLYWQQTVKRDGQHGEKECEWRAIKVCWTECNQRCCRYTIISYDKNLKRT